MPDDIVWNCGQQPIVQGDVLDLGVDGHAASLSQRRRGCALAFPVIGRDHEVQACHLPLDRCRMPPLGIDDVDEWPNLTEFLDYRSICRFGLALVVKRFQQDSFQINVAHAGTPSRRA